MYRLDEGVDAVAKDNSPRDTPVDGSIVNGHWEYGGQLTKHMALQGDGYIDCENSISFASSDGFSVGCWFSPSSLDAAVRNLIHKDGQFGLKHVGTNGVLRFTFTDANGDVQTFDSNAGAVRVGARLFAMVTHDVATSYLENVSKWPFAQDFLARRARACFNKQSLSWDKFRRRYSS